MGGPNDFGLLDYQMCNEDFSYDFVIDKLLKTLIWGNICGVA